KRTPDGRLAMRLADGPALAPRQLDACLDALRHEQGLPPDDAVLTAVATAVFHGADAAAWALIDAPAGAVLLYDGDGAPVAELRGVVFETLGEPEPADAADAGAGEAAEAAEVVPPGPGRRPEMAGYTVAQCLAW